MKRRFMMLLACALFSCFCFPGDVVAAGERTFAYDTGLRMTFGLGYGKKAVRDEAFGRFAREVMMPAFSDGFTMLEGAKGCWVHPDRGPIQERNVVVFRDFLDTPENRAAVDRVAREFLDRFPGSNASVYIVVTQGIQASIVYQQ